MDAVGNGAKGLVREGVGVLRVALEDGVDMLGQQVVESVAVVAQVAVELGGRADGAADAVQLA